MLQDIIVQLQKKAILSVPILKNIEDNIQLFKLPVKIFMDQMSSKAAPFNNATLLASTSSSTR